VVKPRNVKELIQWYGIASGGGHCNRGDISPIPGKAGIDTRSYTKDSYDSFFYADGLEDGLRKYKIIREMADTMMEDGINIPVILKRSCTEFEKKYGPTDSPWWQQFTEDEYENQRVLEDMFTGRWEAAVQPDWLKNKTTLRWLQHANATGDQSWIDYYGKGDFLTCKPVTYHDKLTQTQFKEDKENDTSEN